MLLLVVVLLVDGTRAGSRSASPTRCSWCAGSHTVVDCIDDDVLENCRLDRDAGDPVGRGLSRSTWWPVPLVAADAADLTSLQALAALSALAVGGMLVLVGFPLRRRLGAEWSVVLGITLLTGPFLYVLLPFGEALTVFLAMAFVVAACACRPGWLLVTGLLAGLTKETMAPFLLVLGLVCARSARPLVPGASSAGAHGRRARRRGRGEQRVQRLPVRDHPQHRVHRERYAVPGRGFPVRLAIADWFAPNVGVVWFWCSAASWSWAW